MTALEPPSGHRIRTGCDVVAVADVEESIARFGDRYLRRVFTPAELSHCGGPDRAARLAARFAAKEAVVKALAEPSAAFGFFDVEVETVDSVPQLVLRGTAARLAAEQGWVSSSVSLTHAPCHAAAMVAVTCVEARRSTDG
jgi:holo-[acyl-carrier protein] synthase